MTPCLGLTSVEGLDAACLNFSWNNPKVVLFLKSIAGALGALSNGELSGKYFC